jgi:hypothetical protein
VSDVRVERIASFDGTELAVHRLGQGRPVVLLHGLFSSAEMNWIRFGHAAALVAAGFEAIMPDLRAHGDSAKAARPGAYPGGVLVRDAQARGRGARPGRVRPRRLLARRADRGGGGRRGARAAAARARRGWASRGLCRVGSARSGSSSTRSIASRGAAGRSGRISRSSS